MSYEPVDVHMFDRFLDTLDPTTKAKIIATRDTISMQQDILSKDVVEYNRLLGMSTSIERDIRRLNTTLDIPTTLSIVQGIDTNVGILQSSLSV